MNDYSAITEAIDRLTSVVNQTSNSLFAECISVGIATIGSVLAVLAVELIKKSFFTPCDEFRRLQRRVNSTLALYACYYSNPITADNLKEREGLLEKYNYASFEIRKMAVDISAFADTITRRKCCGIDVEDIRKASALLMGLSNSFWSTGTSEDRNDRNTRVGDIKKLLKLNPPKKSLFHKVKLFLKCNKDVKKKQET